MLAPASAEPCPAAAAQLAAAPVAAAAPDDYAIVSARLADEPPVLKARFDDLLSAEGGVGGKVDKHGMLPVALWCAPSHHAALDECVVKG